MEQVSNNIISTIQMAAFCFQTLEAKLKKNNLPPPPQQFKNIVCPIFVTWNMQNQLRGCIGTFQPSSLHKILPKYTLISALQDNRFQPISLQQIAKLSVCVSLLINFKSNQDHEEWQIGRHGVIMNLKRNGRQYQATYLPQVALEWQWNQKQTLKSLLEKSGCHLPFNLVKKDIKLTTYQSSKIQLSYQTYLNLKKLNHKKTIQTQSNKPRQIIQNNNDRKLKYGICNLPIKKE